MNIQQLLLCTAALFSIGESCVPTSVITTTTTAPCCPMLSQTTLPRRNPSVSTYQQCSILRRVSSTCPVDGIVVCDAADETNPSSIQIEFFNDSRLVRTQAATGSPASTVSVQVICVDGVWHVPDATGDVSLIRPKWNFV